MQRSVEKPCTGDDPAAGAGLDGCTFTFMHFKVRALPKVQNHFRKHFLIKCYMITILNFFWERFGQN